MQSSTRKLAMASDFNSNSELQPRHKVSDMPAADENPQLPALVLELRERLQDKEKCAGHLRTQNDEFLAMFLRVKAYNLDRALEALEKYYRHFETFPQMLKNVRTSAHYGPLYDSNIFTRLHGQCKVGNPLCLMRIGGWDVSKYELLTVRQCNLFYGQELIQSPTVQLRGCTIVVDLSGCTFGHVRRMGPSDMHHFVQTCQDGLPFRIAAVHMINYPAIFLGLYYIAYGFMKEKLRKRIHFHKELNSLHRHVDKEVLPKELGGCKELAEVVDHNIARGLMEADKHYADYYL